MRIQNFDTAKKILIIAEIGNNHEGRFDVAQELVRKAAEAGVDGVKFQTFRTEHYINVTDQARYNRLKSFELSPAQFKTLRDLARSLGLLYMSTPFDLESAAFLEDLVDAFKIASGDLPFYPLISRVIKTGKPVIISTGASDFKLIEQTIKHIKAELKNKNESEQIALLHCISSYPVPPDQANLRAITAMRKRFPYSIGYSDHTVGIEAASCAAALGARIIEKHFTLDKNFSSFRDHQLSADPAEMQDLVKKIRHIESLLGTEEKTIQPCESESVHSLRRSIVAVRDLPAGTVLTQDDLTWTRPAGNLAPGQENRLIGKQLRVNISMGHPFKESDIE